MIKKAMSLIALSCVFSTFSREEKPKIEQVKLGNFALPASQMPGPLISFGQNIVDQGDLQLFVFADDLIGCNKNYSEVAPSILYGIRDDFSVWFEVGIATQFKLNNQTSHGLEDLLLQFEYVVYNNETTMFSNQITVVINMTFPTGSSSKIPPTGFGAPSFFFGFTAYHYGIDWYPFISAGVILPTPNKDSKFGNQFLYQAGLTKNIRYVSEQWIFDWMIEFDGIYKQRDKFYQGVDLNSSGNQIFLGPSLWFSTQHFLIQGGFSWVIYQHLFGNKNKDKYFAALNTGWKF